MSELLSAAEVYCACGLAVIPWEYQQRAGKDGTLKWDKVPTRKWKVSDVPRMTAADVVDHWTKRPADNVGIITGFMSGIVVIDCDDDAAVQWAAEHLPPTPWRLTTGRGLHLGYRYPDSTDDDLWIRSAAHLLGMAPAPQLDIRADGGYAAMPPSLHKTGRTYEWASDDFDDLGELIDALPVFDPAWLPGVKRESVKSRERSADLDWETESAGGDVVAATSWLNLEPPAVSGQLGRNQTFRVGATLTRDFGLTFKQAWPLMLDYNERCQPPWDEAALLGKLEDGFVNGSGVIGCRVPLPFDLGAIAAKLSKPCATTSTAVSAVVAAPAPVAVHPQPQELTVADVEAAPAVIAPAPAAQAAPITGCSDAEFIVRLAAESARNTGAPFIPGNLEVAARFARDRRDLYQQLKVELRALKIDIKDWQKAVRDVLQAAKAAKIHELQSNPNRREIAVNNDEMLVRDQLLEILHQCSGIFVTAGKLSFVDGTGKMVELAGGALRNFLVNNCRSVTKSTDVMDGNTEVKPTTVPANVIAMLEDLLPEQLEKFRVVAQVVRAPYFTKAGSLVCEPGYNPEAQAILVDTPSIDFDLFTSPADAVAYLTDIFSEFEFQSHAEFANYLGAMLTPLVRPSYTGATLWLLLEANMPGSGKTLLAECLQILYGYKANRNVLSYREEEIEKTMLSILQETRPVVLFDNVKHGVDSATIEAIATAGDEYQGRMLGRNENRVCPVRQLFVITSNNATMSSDAARRFMRVRLRRTKPAQLSGDRPKYKLSDIRGWVHAHRAEMLAALICIAKSWFDAGRPLPASVPIVPSFEAYCETVGGMLHHVGVTDWLTNFDESRRSFAVNDEWGPFFQIWWDTHKGAALYAGSLFQLANQHGLLSGITARATEQTAKLAAFGKRLGDMRDYVEGGFRIIVESTLNSKPKFKLEKV